MRRFLTGIAAGAIGAGLMLGALTFTGVIGGHGSAGAAVKTAFASYAGGNGLNAEQIYQQRSAGVVEIVSTFPGSTDMFGQTSGGGQGIGTGFVVSKDGYILTNAHVVSENGQTAQDVTVVFKGSGSQTTKVAGTIAGVDESTDVAVIKVDPSQAPALKPVPLGDSSKVQVGEPVVAIGNPLGLDFSVSSGIVSAVDREMQSPNGSTIRNGIQTDASINPGNSGGPLFDADGNVIGINEQIASQSGGNEGIGFAVPINTAVAELKQLESGGVQQSQQQATPDQSGALGF